MEKLMIDLQSTLNKRSIDRESLVKRIELEKTTADRLRKSAREYNDAVDKKIKLDRELYEHDKQTKSILDSGCEHSNHINIDDTLYCYGCGWEREYDFRWEEWGSWYQANPKEDVLAFIKAANKIMQ